MKKQALLSLLLAALLLTSTACGSGDTKEPAANTNDTAAETESTATETETESETLYADHLPDALDFGGATVRIHTRGDDDSLMEVAVDELNGDVLNDAIYNRNTRVSERLNVVLERVDGAGWADYYNETIKIKNSVAAADNAYQCIAGWNTYIVTLAIENCFLDLNKLPYLETNMSWWNQSAVETLPLGGKQLFLTGDISFLTTLGGAYVLFTNDKVATDNNIPDIPDMVRDGSWTLDRMIELTKTIYNDVDGNGVMDEKDTYGFVTDMGVDSWYIASDIHQIQMVDGFPVYTPDQERVTNLIEKIAQFFYNGSTVGSLLIDTETQCEMFMNNQALMIIRELDNARVYFRDMQDSYTLIPLPKYDETQSNYYSNVYIGATLWCIPTDNTEPETAAAVMEALAAESYVNLMPTYFETCLQSKLARNENTIEMLGIIRNGAVADAECIYKYLFGAPNEIVRVIWDNKNAVTNTASWYAKNNEKIQAQIDSTIDTIQNMQ